jgi:hypothetical protein
VCTGTVTAIEICHTFSDGIETCRLDDMTADGGFTMTSALHDSERARYSNSGEVMLDGSATLAGSGSTGDVRGTSFAAPRLSARHALHLMRGHPTTCGTDSRSQHLPPLGYTDITVETATPQWRNLTLGEAVPAYCPLFPAS